MSQQFAVIGLGRFGTSVARSLMEAGVEVLAIDQNLEVIQSVADEVSQAVCFDATVRGNLEAHSVQSMNGLVVGIGENFEATILITAMAKEMGLPLIVSRAYDSVQKRILGMVGATEVVNPEEEMGARLARSLARRDVADFVDLPEGFEMREVKVTKKHHEISLGELFEAAGDRLVCVRLARETPGQDGEAGKVARFPIPLEDTQLLEGDSLVLIGAARALDRL